jgi:intracellular sulfur oxidation DsrE/DsrF family protein
LFLLRQAEHINQAIKTVDQLMVNNNSQVIPGNIVIIVCGEVVTSLTTKDGEEWVQKLATYKNVSLVACGLSLEKFGKKETDLKQGVEYTHNGFIKAFELQKKGYLSVEL